MKIVRIKMRYSIELRGRIYVKGYGFLSFAKKMGKSLSSKYRLLDSAKKSASKNDAIKTASKREIQKTAEATGDLTGNKITSISEKSAKTLQNNETEVGVKKATPKKRHISSEEKQQITAELRLVQKKDNLLMNLC